MNRSAVWATALSGLFILVCGTYESRSQTSSAIPTADAKAYFKEAETMCLADGGRLWGVSLYGPIMLVDPGSRSVVANYPDKEGVLREESGVFLGKLPTSQNIANSAVTWAGVKWTQLMWPLLADAGERRKLIAHELFHRVQGQNRIPSTSESRNEHLDSLEGRYYLQLEWRALARALQADAHEDRKMAISDAFLFRAARYAFFPEAPAQERSLELNEGLAEYTGVKLSNATPEEQTRATLRNLEIHAADSTFVRSFAYATGPAYALLLDRYVPEWLPYVFNSEGIDAMLQKAMALRIPEDIKALATSRADSYDGKALRASETEREARRQQRIASYRAKLIDGPVLIIPLLHMQVQFDPRNLQPLEKIGTVYPNLRITDDWGILEADNGALLKADWRTVIVAAPACMQSLKGNGWTLELKPGWKIISGSRKGDFTLSGGL